jgi:hypothetical protein
VDGLVAGEGGEHVEQGLDYREAPAVGARVVLGRAGHNGVRRIAERHGVPDTGPKRPEPVGDPGTGLRSAVPRGVDSNEVRRDDCDHGSTISDLIYGGDSYVAASRARLWFRLWLT